MTVHPARCYNDAMALPNILYLHSHDTGRYVQPYGHAVSTPNIQRLAETGILFRQAFCAGPSCSPSRASLLTGQYPHNNGMLGLAHRGFRLFNLEHHIVYTLRRAGYYSAVVGAQHITESSPPIAYDELLAVETEYARDVAPAAAAFLRRVPTQPFFFSVGFSETHREFPAPLPEDDPRYCLPPPTLPDTPAIREDMAAFKTSARMLDAGIGEVLTALEQSGLADNTLVINTTDHGIAFPGMKCNLTDQGIGVSLILRGPGGLTGGKVSDALVSHIDLFPTICDLLGIPAPDWLQGRSLVPLVRGAVEQGRDEIFAEINYHAAYEPQRAVRTRRYKYIRRYDGRTTPVLPNTDDSPSKTLWMESGWRTRAVAQERLHDLIFDPGEACNVAADAAYAGVLNEMRVRLERWMQETNDPLLYGDLPVPPGAVANDPNQISPSEPIHPLS